MVTGKPSAGSGGECRIGCKKMFAGKTAGDVMSMSASLLK
jgi:hypothetical protein